MGEIKQKSAVAVVGAGLAGCEAAYQLAKRGITVTLYDIKPTKLSPAHKSELFAELVCSNSLRSNNLSNAAGLLKQELRLLDSLIMRAADANKLPAGGALAVDRDNFSRAITDEITQSENITFVNQEITSIPDGPCVIATGPLTSGGLFESIQTALGKANLHFFDAAAPVIFADSLDYDKVFRASRYGKGGEDYLNCPMTRDEYFAFYHALLTAEQAPLSEFDKATFRVFEGCMPVEQLALRGELTLAYGPLKPVGLTDPRTGKRPFAVVQLRQDDAQGRLFNLVGFQTNLKFPEQQRVFAMIPGLENAEFARFGVMHRNTFISAPGTLTSAYNLIDREELFFAGQITGVEGYIESVASGLCAALNMARLLSGQSPVDFSDITAIGALSGYVSGYTGSDYQPMHVNFGIIAPLEERVKNKQNRYLAVSERAIAHLEALIAKEKI